jgi:hypothetical protein
MRLQNTNEGALFGSRLADVGIHTTGAEARAHSVEFVAGDESPACRSSERFDAVSDAEGVGTPVLDAFLDLLAIEILFEGLLGERDDFIVGGEAEADQLIFIEAIDLGVPLGGSQGLKTQAFFETNDAVLDLYWIAAHFSDKDKSCQGENYQPFSEDVEVFYCEAQDDDEVDDQDSQKDQVERGIEAAMIL